MSEDIYRQSAAIMGTIVTIDTVCHSHNPEKQSDAMTRAFQWFERIEECCTRFDPQSELMRLTARVGEPVHVSAILYEAIQFAVAVAEQSGGAFDPTVGLAMESQGYNREHRSGNRVETMIEQDGHASFRDIRVDAGRKEITLMRPLVLDLGGVAKGLAIDMAARELAPLENFAIDAGGDLYLGGRRSETELWSVGIRHPQIDGAIIERLPVSDRAVCTSGQYERPNHIVDPRTDAVAEDAASVTVVATSAMLADALATAAFVLGPRDGIELLNRSGVDGIIFSSALERYSTSGLSA